MKRKLSLICALLFLLAGCSSDADSDDPDIEDVGTDDVDDEADDDVHEGPPSQVDIELSDYLEGGADPTGSATVYEITDEADLLQGSAATGQVGDFVLENDAVRFVVKADVRTMSACPWGGNVIDAQDRSARAGGDILGEICLFLNADQTFKPESYEIVDGGSEGAAVLAVTGSTEILDFLNVEKMIADQTNQAFANRFSMKPDGLLPFQITKYFVLRPGDRGVRVLTAMRNDGDETINTVVSHLMVSGSDGSYFNPLSSRGGFGYEDLGLMNPNPDRLPFLALVNDDSSVAYMPRADERLDGEVLPISGTYLTLFNVAASVLGQTDILGTLLANQDQLSQNEGVFQMAPGQVEVVEHWTFVGDGALSTIVDVIYDELGAETGAIEGVVRGGDDSPIEGARVTAVDDTGRTMNQTISDGDGRYDMRVPAGEYEVTARGADHYTDSPVTAAVAAGDTTNVDDVITIASGTVAVNVRTADGEPTSARVSVICEGECAHKATSNEWDVTLDGLPEEFATIEWVGVTGDHEFTIPEGNYRLVISRGMEWSLWPADAMQSGGEEIEVIAGQTLEVDAEIAQVVDTSGAMSGDFHVHALSSLDSTTPKVDRVLTFLSEGVDLIVSSDHDVIADYGPAAEALGAEDEIVTLIGNEITTIDLGHFNGFPLTVDSAARYGGALDWAGGAGLALAPSAIYDWVRSFPGEQVVQINHPDSSYMSFSDVLRGITYGDNSRMRVQTPDYDPDTGDTGLWTDDFSAMELMNGPHIDRFWGVARWWLTLIGRGETPTGTAVTDTHTRYGRVMGGVPRTYIFVDDDKDSPSTFDVEHFVEAVNAQQVIGTNGPFLRVEATNDGGDEASIGDVLETNGESVNFAITIEVPEWIDVDSIEMVMNSEDVVTEPGGYDTDPIPATETFAVALTEDDLDLIAIGENEHRRYRKTIEFDVDTDVDAYVVFFVRGSQGMYPILPDDEILPFAFTNPIYLDVDGDGYSNPHLAELAASDPAAGTGLQMLQEQSGNEEVRHMSREQLLEVIEEHSHDGHGHHHHH